MCGGFLCGKLAVVTGGSGTIGRAIAKALVSSGASVVLTARRPEKLASVKDEILEGWNGHSIPHIYCIASDVSKEDSVVELFQKIDGLSQGIDLLINNAGTNLTDRYMEKATGIHNAHHFPKQASWSLVQPLSCRHLIWNGFSRLMFLDHFCAQERR
jgi:NAD(P)-dependent dehydrogenase (short-subunit alcohol dehydrogenase family)